ncbi:flavin-containing monooxygenase [Salsipaludibacter albus]|uniref:flavin-containing monooxygenase n=1 Tax=Salsipaludibacter albus TaxID=2849650 RepID=UPI001EE46818|nr:NAD(P)/FAD-dependent oxidoreductase [Salsipaludibacter albus]MBY5161013.1 NAD(P)/FAD-dependent oxidoreductase [Salsipaludibacter albus]
MHTHTLVIGAGQAGLALSHHLVVADHDHVVLDRGRIAERWRSERPDSFRLLTPNWINRLPGDRPPDDPHGFADRATVVDRFTDWATGFGAPVHTGTTVRTVRRRGRRWEVLTDRGRYEAEQVVVATGHMDRPTVPALAASLPPEVFQVHSSRYRNPALLPPGTTLVVGAGPSGQQIADELARAGRRVVLAAGTHHALRRRYRGSDVYHWMQVLGLLDRTVDTLPDPGAAAARSRSSVLEAGHEDLDLRRLHRHGVTVVGRLSGVDGGVLHFGGDLARDLAAADANAVRLRRLVDEHVDRTGTTAPDEDVPPPRVPRWAQSTVRSLDLRDRQVTSVVWATGYHRDWSWVQADVFGRSGEPIHWRGITAEPGLAFLGLRWLYRRDSGFIGGVGRDAAHLAERLLADRVPVPG